jgi:hypothetical protein
MHDTNRDGGQTDQEQRRGHPQTWNQRWGATTLSNRLMVIATIAIAIASFINLAVAVGQWMILGRQLDEMGAATNYAERQQILAIGQLSATNRGVGYAQKQADAAQDSVKAITRQMRQDQRPWIKVSEGLNDIKLEKGQEITGWVTYQNIGKTVATDIVGEWRIEKIMEGEIPRFPYTKINARDVVITGIVFPADPVVTSTATWYQPLTPTQLKTNTPPDKRFIQDDDVRDFTEGKAFLIMYGRFRYSDTFGVKHWTKFCSWRSFKTGYYHARDCAAYSRADKNN